MNGNSPISRTFQVVGHDADIVKMVLANGHHLTGDVDEADAVIFTGGADVSPFLYGEKKRAETSLDFKRDLAEVKFFKSLPSKKPKIGICRGGQFLNVMSGGAMIQHVDNHALRGTHDVKDLASGELVMCTSTHHQMMNPADNAMLIGLAKEASFKCYEQTEIRYTPDGRRTWDDVEVCYYPHTNSLCFQPHPEYVRQDHPCQVWFWELVEKYCFS